MQRQNFEMKKKKKKADVQKRLLADPVEGKPASHQHAQMLLWRFVGMCVCV